MKRWLIDASVRSAANLICHTVIIRLVCDRLSDHEFTAGELLYFPQAAERHAL